MNPRPPMSFARSVWFHPATLTGPSIVAALAMTVALGGCAGSGNSEAPAAMAEAEASPAPAEPAMARSTPATPAIERLGGDMDVQTTGASGDYRCGEMIVNTELPAGYPAPTPPGAIELKRYPAVRRAEVSSTANPDIGMNLGFFPLFQHISSREIAMTSPVEMDYTGMLDRPMPSRWTMSFLYRTPDLGPVSEAGVGDAGIVDHGPVDTASIDAAPADMSADAESVSPTTGRRSDDGKVRVVDTAPVTVISIGMRGPYGSQLVRKGLNRLEVWLANQSEWRAAGDPRALYYNGPDVPTARLWSEVQIPVAPIDQR